MSLVYVKQSLSPDEDIVHIGQFHWIYTVNALLSILWGVLVCVGVIIGGIYFTEHFGNGFRAGDALGMVRELHPAIKIGAFMSMVLGLLRFAQMMIIKATTEIAITTSRLIYKRGLVARQVGEMSIDRIEGVNVLQSILGRIFNYGRVMIRGMGVGEVVLPPLENPIAFRRAIETARTS